MMETGTAPTPHDGMPGQKEHDLRIHKFELLISNLLRTGVCASLFIVLLGTLLSFARQPGYANSPGNLKHLTAPGAKFPVTLPEVASGVRDLRGQSVVMAGVLLLIATPVMRVAVSILAFAYQRDKTFVLITSIVLALLLISFMLGKAGG